MSDDETLTDGERAFMCAAPECDNALRIIERQARRIASALAIASEPLPADSPEDRLAGDVRRALEGAGMQ